MLEKTGVKRRPSKMKKFFYSFVNYKAWVSYDELGSNVSRMLSLVKNFCAINKRPKEIMEETYEESIARLGLSAADEEKRRKTFWWSSIIYLIFCVLFLIYFFYLLLIGRIFIALLVTIFIGIMGLSAYREHFWYFQMTKRRLGNTFKDWWNFMINNDKHNKI